MTTQSKKTFLILSLLLLFYHVVRILGVFFLVTMEEKTPLFFVEGASFALMLSAFYLYLDNLKEDTGGLPTVSEAAFQAYQRQGSLQTWVPQDKSPTMLAWQIRNILSAIVGVPLDEVAGNSGTRLPYLTFAESIAKSRNQIPGSDPMFHQRHLYISLISAAHELMSQGREITLKHSPWTVEISKNGLGVMHFLVCGSRPGCPEVQKVVSLSDSTQVVADLCYHLLRPLIEDPEEVTRRYNGLPS